ncbi:hypothetical protein C8Q80DRAFT_1179787 [Daedaleopsis nitida]|nr:hypothetical protein C8Q80DRAFT_1179787 [Daedaleopsis nitida]
MYRMRYTEYIVEYLLVPVMNPYIWRVSTTRPSADNNASSCLHSESLYPRSQKLNFSFSSDPNVKGYT